MLEAGVLLFKSPHISTNTSFPTCLNAQNLTKTKWEQSKMPIPMCFTFLLTIAALAAARYSCIVERKGLERQPEHQLTHSCPEGHFPSIAKAL